METQETQLVQAQESSDPETLGPDGAAPERYRGRLRRPRGWLVWGAPTLIAVAVLASVLLLVGAMRGLSDAACAAEPAAKPAAVPAEVPAPGVSHSGNATFFDLAASGGSGCSYDGAPADDMYVALSLPEFTNGAGCGIYLNVTGPNGNTVRVEVVDSCGPCATGHIDLSQKAFAALADPDIGDIQVNYKTVVNPSLPGPLKFKMNDVNEYYFAILPINNGNELTSVTANGTSLTRNGDGYWVANNGVGGGPVTVTLTDVMGHVRTVSGVELLGGQTQGTGVYMYSGSGGSYTGSGTTTTRTHKKKAASPSAKATPSPKHTLELPGAIAATAAPTGPAVGRPDAVTTAAGDAKKRC